MTTLSHILEASSCWFCGKEKASAAASHVVHLWKDLRSPIDWSKHAVSVPRCEKCKGRHKLAALIKPLTMVTFFIGMVVSGIFLKELPMNHPMHGLAAWCFVVMLLLFIASSCVDLIAEAAMKNLGTRPVEQEERYIEVRALLDAGWRVGKEPPEILRR